MWGLQPYSVLHAMFFFMCVFCSRAKPANHFKAFGPLSPFTETARGRIGVLMLYFNPEDHFELLADNTISWYNSSVYNYREKVT